MSELREREADDTCCHSESFDTAHPWTQWMTGGILPGVNADVNVASAVDPDHLFCYGFFKHIIHKAVASIPTVELRKELTAMVQSLVFPSGTTTLYRMERGRITSAASHISSSRLTPATYFV